MKTKQAIKNEVVSLISLTLGAVIAAFSIEEFLAPNDIFAGMVFGADRGMYSLLMYMITSRVIDIVEIGGNRTFSVMVITENGRGIAEKIISEEPNSTFSTVSEVSEIIGEHIKTYGDLQ